MSWKEEWGTPTLFCHKCRKVEEVTVSSDSYSATCVRCGHCHRYEKWGWVKNLFRRTA